MQLPRLAPFFAIALACGGSPPPTSPAPLTGAQPGPAAAASPPAATQPAAAASAAVEDPYLWLEDVGGDKPLAWVRERNQASLGELESAPGFAATRDRVRAILDSKDKLPFVVKRGAFLYNTWTDEQHPRGVVRRTSLAEYRKPAPAWETVLDIDALGAREHESWVFKGMSCLYPAYDRCLVSLSRGGGDAIVIREFDAVKKAFVEGGFSLPESKGGAEWKDRDTLYVARDFGPGTLTTSGYPRQIKELRRGQPLSAATLVFEGQATDVEVSATRQWDHGATYDLLTRATSFYSNETYLRSPRGALTRIDAPVDAELKLWNGQLLITLRAEWSVGGKTWPAGALLATDLAAFLAGKRTFTMLFEPSPTRSLIETTPLKTAVIVTELEDVRDRLSVWAFAGGAWRKQPLRMPPVGELDAVSVDALDPTGTDDRYWMTTTGYTTPTTQWLGALGSPPAALKRMPAFFDAKGLAVEQHFATSRDGTRVPYFQIARAGLALDGSHPTILNGYGGFLVSLTPAYDAPMGASWLERGGVFVVANIRGGGEYGPRWHEAALRHNRQRAYDDFIAVAEDLIARKVTSPKHLGIIGGSNGGLLMGVMLTQRPDLFGAIVCAVPLLDMKRYHKLPAGASWMEEYGDPDKPDDWAALAKYSPYQNVRAGVKYPRTLFASSTRDDRVHPGHGRKMVARMLEQGHDVLYYENTEGGHGGAADAAQAARVISLRYTFFARQLGLPSP